MTHLFFHGCTTKDSQIYYVWSLLPHWVPDLHFQLSAGHPYLGFPHASHIQHVKNQSHSASPTCFPTCILSWLMEQLATQLARNHGVLLTRPSLSFLFFFTLVTKIHPSRLWNVSVLSLLKPLVWFRISQAFTHAAAAAPQPRPLFLHSFAWSTLQLSSVLTPRSHVIPLLVFLYWLPIVFRTKSKFLNLTYKILYHLVLSTFRLHLSMMAKK